MKYKAQGAENSFSYFQALQRSSSQKPACPFGLRQKWRAMSSKTLSVVPATARGFFLISCHFWQQRIATILLR
jgi:hypothetical protein